MLTEPLYQGLQDLGLRGMARTFAAQEKDTSRDLNFNERLALLIDAEQSERRNYRYAQRVRWAKLGQSASLEDLDSRAPRGLDRSLIAQLGSLPSQPMTNDPRKRLGGMSDGDLESLIGRDLYITHYMSPKWPNRLESQVW